MRALSRELGPGVSVDIGEIGHVDVAGAYLIDRTVRGAAFENTETPLDLIGDNDKVRRLLQTERAAIQSCPTREPHPHGFIAMLARTGHAIHDAMDEGLANLSFLGATLTTIAKLIVNPRRMRWAALFHTMEVACLNALAIIALLSFFIGAVVAFLGARVLQDFGATMFTVELVAFSVLREFAVGNFERTFAISDEISRDQIEATVAQGVLKLVLPKSKTAAMQKVTVKAG